MHGGSESITDHTCAPPEGGAGVWRAARQAAEQACQEERVEETRRNGEREKGRKETQQQQKAAAAAGSAAWWRDGDHDRALLALLPKLRDPACH